jgi:molybdopterin synthase sulfur carrier subunit
LKVNVKFFAIARELVGTPEQELELAEGSSVKDLLDQLSNQYGVKFREFIFDAKTGEPKSNIQFLVGDKLVVDLDGLATLLPDGAAFAIIPPVGGG